MFLFFAPRASGCISMHNLYLLQLQLDKLHKVIIFMGYWWTITNCDFISKREPKGAQISKFCIFARFNTCFQHFTVSNTLFCQATYCVKQSTVSILAFNIHLFSFPMSTCCDRIKQLEASLSLALYFCAITFIFLC